jgi:hypothetical protein
VKNNPTNHQLAELPEDQAEGELAGERRPVQGLRNSMVPRPLASRKNRALPH